jgi:preprotein translocase subunit SecA
MRGRIEEEIVRYLWHLRPVLQGEGDSPAAAPVPVRPQPRRQALNYNNPAEQVPSAFSPSRPASDAPPEFGGAAPRPARVGGDDAPIKTVKREEPKIGRNDPCWCGSGKKYKKCHGAA